MHLPEPEQGRRVPAIPLQGVRPAHGHPPVQVDRLQVLPVDGVLAALAGQRQAAAAADSRIPGGSGRCRWAKGWTIYLPWRPF